MAENKPTGTQPPAYLAELVVFAYTTEAGQQRYYQAEQVEKVLRTTDEIIACRERESAALRQYIDTMLSELLADATLPESIQKVLHVHRQMLVVAKGQADV